MSLRGFFPTYILNAQPCPRGRGPPFLPFCPLRHAPLEIQGHWGEVFKCLDVCEVLAENSPWHIARSPRLLVK